MGVILKNPVLIGGAILALLVVVAVTRRGSDGGGSMFEKFGRGVAGAAEDVAVGVVKGAGAAVGIPDTDPDSCARALAEGRLWDASFACPALTFLRGLAGVKPDPALMDTPGGAGGNGATGAW